MEQNFISSEKDCRMFNGQTVMSILHTLGDVATVKNICDEIAQSTNQPNEVIEPEVKSILRRGVSHGFLVKFGQNYLLSGQDKVVEVDSRRKAYKNVGRGVTRRTRNVKSVRSKTGPVKNNDYLRHGNVALMLEQTDCSAKNSNYVIVRPNETVNAILDDLQEEIRNPEKISKEELHFIDLGGIITRNLLKASIYFPADENYENFDD